MTIRRCAAVPLLGLLFTLLPADAPAQQIYLRVVDMLGTSVTDLRPEEITVREDGVARELVDVRLANLPMKLTILVDNGEVMNNRFMHFRDGLTAMLEALPENQILSILTLARQPRWLVRQTTDREKIQDRIDILTPDPADLRFLDALVEASERIDDTEEPHRAVIVVVSADTVDDSTIHQDRYNDLANRLLQHQVTLHAVVIAAERSAGANFIPQASINLTDLTHGYYGSIATTIGITDRLVEIAGVINARNRELSRQLVVRYCRPDDAPPPQQVVVEIARDGLRFDLTADGRVQ